MLSLRFAALRVFEKTFQNVHNYIKVSNKKFKKRGGEV